MASAEEMSSPIITLQGGREEAGLGGSSLIYSMKQGIPARHTTSNLQILIKEDQINSQPSLKL